MGGKGTNRRKSRAESSTAAISHFFLSPRVPWPPLPAGTAESDVSGGTCLQDGWCEPRLSSSDIPALMWTLGSPRLSTGPVPATMPLPCACCCVSALTLPIRTAMVTRRCTLLPARALMVSGSGELVVRSWPGLNREPVNNVGNTGLVWWRRLLTLGKQRQEDLCKYLAYTSELQDYLERRYLKQQQKIVGK